MLALSLLDSHLGGAQSSPRAPTLLQAKDAMRHPYFDDLDKETVRMGLVTHIPATWLCHHMHPTNPPAHGLSLQVDALENEALRDRED